MRPKQLWKIFALGFIIWFPLSIYLLQPLDFIELNICFWSSMVLVGLALFYWFDSRSLEEVIKDMDKERDISRSAK